MLISFTGSSFNLAQAVNKVKALVNVSTELTYQQKNDCVEALLSIQDEAFEPGLYTIDKSISFTGSNGYTCFVVYSASQNYDKDLLQASVTLSIDNTTASTGTVTPATSTVTVDPITAVAWVPPAPPSLPARGALTTNFTTLEGISVILPDAIANIDTLNQEIPLSYHIIGGYAYTTGSTGYIVASVNTGGPGTKIPTYTSATLYHNNAPVASGYSVMGALISSINLYYNVQTDGPVTLVIETTGTKNWLVNSKLDAFGPVRFTNASTRGFVVGTNSVSAYPGTYDIAFSATGCVPGTYVSEANFVNSFDTSQVLNAGRNFHYSFNEIGRAHV